MERRREKDQNTQIMIKKKGRETLRKKNTKMNERDKEKNREKKNSDSKTKQSKDKTKRNHQRGKGNGARGSAVAPASQEDTGPTRTLTHTCRSGRCISPTA